MPELPEVESLRLSLLRPLIGRVIQDVKVLKPKLVSSSGTVRIPDDQKVKEFESVLIGEKILGVERIAKNLIISLSRGKMLLIHLKMTGQLVYQDKKKRVYGGHPYDDARMTLPHKHSHIIFTLDKGSLFYNDIRMFGYVLYFPSREELLDHKGLKGLGVDPTSKDFAFEGFYAGMKKKKKNIKSVFLEQSVVMGLGNIYADEVCFAAGVRPTRRTNTITKVEYKKLYDAIKIIIPRAIAMGGSSLANYIQADGSRGTYGQEHKVYGRGGKQCFQCKKDLKGKVVAGRTTVYCSVCQR